MNYRSIIAAFLSMLIGSTDAIARQWFVEPELFLSAGFDDNPYLVTDAADSDSGDGVAAEDDFTDQFFGDFNGRIRLGSESDIDLIAFDADVSALRYENDALDTERIQGMVLYERAGLSHDFSIETGYLESSSLEDFIGTGETAFSPFGRTQLDVDRNEFFFLPALTSRFSSNWTGDFGFGYRDLEYDDPGDSYVDYEEFSVFAELRRFISERTGLIGVVNALFYRPKAFDELGDVEQEDAYGLMIGLDHRINPQFDASFVVGPGSVDTTVVGRDGFIDFSDDTPIYVLDLNYTGQLMNGSVSIANFFETFGDGGVSETQSTTFSFSRPETLGGLFSFSATYFSRNPILSRGLVASGRDYYTLVPSISWDINRDLALTFDIIYREQEIVSTDLLSDMSRVDDAKSTAFRIGARYNWGRKVIGK